MWEASYGKEPFDLRLTVLRLIRNLHKILALTAAGTLLFGGIYYVKNVLCGPAAEYAATSTYKVQYVKEPAQSGDYYINAATWDSLVHTREFLSAVQRHLAEIEGLPAETQITLADAETEKLMSEVRLLSVEELSAVISAKLPSDWHVPTTTVVTDTPEKSMVLAGAVEQAMEQEFREMMSNEVASVKVLDPALKTNIVLPDVRPLRAFVLSGILSCFFVVVGFLLKETGDDSIWLPISIRRRFGLPVLGTPESVEFVENSKYLFKDKKRIAVCSVDERIHPAEVLKEIAAKLQEREESLQEGQKEGTTEIKTAISVACQEWIPMPTPLLCPEVCEKLRETDGLLLAVKAGAGAGKRLEYVREMLEQQDCKITAVVLWEADEALLRAYYFGRRKPTEYGQ